MCTYIYVYVCMHIYVYMYVNKVEITSKEAMLLKSQRRRGCLQNSLPSPAQDSSVW